MNIIRLYDDKIEFLTECWVKCVDELLSDDNDNDQGLNSFEYCTFDPNAANDGKIKLTYQNKEFKSENGWDFSDDGKDKYVVFWDALWIPKDPPRSLDFLEKDNVKGVVVYTTVDTDELEDLRTSFQEKYAAYTDKIDYIEEKLIINNLKTNVEVFGTYFKDKI